MDGCDVDSYLSRIEYDGPRAVTLEVLHELQLRHTSSIPFENLDPALGREVRLDLKAVHCKLVLDRRGGYCFEHNLLFQAALRTLGFEATCLGARVYLDRPAEAGIPARTHLALRVVIDGVSFLADVGFGGQTPTGPLDMAAVGAAQATPHEPYRIVKAGSEFGLEAHVAGVWKLLYRFGLDEPPPIDLEVANHYVSTHPTSFFRNAIVAARIAADGRHTLMNERLTFHRLGGETEKRTLRDAAELREALDNTFGIAVPGEGALADAFARVTGA